MAFEGLSTKLQGALKKMAGRGKLNEQTVKEGMREVRMAMLEADVNYAVTRDFIKKVTEKCIGQQVLSSLTPEKQVLKVVADEMTELMGGSNAKLNWSPSVPTIFMLCGLQGAGKTTMAGKLAGMLIKQGKKPMLAACDIYRPAAIKQLQVVGEKVGIPVFEKGTQDPVKTAKEAIDYARYYQRDVLIIDTAGRLAIDEDLMDELDRVKTAVQPSEILLVVDAMTGQDAVNVAKGFNDKLDITGVILTKLDGDTRGGAALSVRAVTGKPIKFSGTGEKLTDIETFHPDRMASRILGMGDLATLMEDVSQTFTDEDVEKLGGGKLSNMANMTLDDFLQQMQAAKKMDMRKMMSMLPGMSGKDVQIDPNALKKPEAIIRSMTKAERRNPNLLNASRRKRIAAGSGTTVQDVNQLIRQFEQSKQMIKQLTGKGMRGMLNRYKGMKFPGM